jgi:tripartite-type tricarboxylate transporter receptor subunit TctC
LSMRLGQSVVIENRPGAGSNISVLAALNAPSDGYTLLYAASVQAINATLYDALPFNFIRDFVPVATIAEIPLIMVVSPSLPTNSVTEFIAYAKSTSGNINMASFGTGSSSHLAGELLKFAAGIDMTHIPYRGSAPALTDLISDRVQVMFDTPVSSLPHIRSGALRPLAVTMRARSKLFPNIPTIAETIPGYEAEPWNGIVVRKGTPPEIVSTLDHEIKAALDDAAVQARFLELGAIPRRLGQAEFKALIEAETQKWAKVVKLSGAKAE